MEPKVKTQKKIPGASSKTQKNRWTIEKLTPKNPMPILWPLIVTLQRKTLETEHSCLLFIIHVPSE